MVRFSRDKSVFVVLAALLLLTGCGSLGSPVAITDRPLSERIEERNAAAELMTEESIAALDDDVDVPTAIAFSEALASGDFIRLSVSTNGVDTSLRSGPGSSYAELAQVSEGTQILATGTQTGEWVYVIYGDFEGWISERRVEIDGDSSDGAIVDASQIDSSRTVYVVDGESIGVNMRAEPDADAALVSGASAGSEVVGTGRVEGTWIEITFNGATGWSSSNYLSQIGTVDSLSN